MSDDERQRGPADTEHVNVNEQCEVRYWTQKWGVTEAELRLAVHRVGPIIKDVANALGK